MKIFLLCCLAWLFAFLPCPAAALQTTVTVRVISQDAKFIGTGMGGIRVTLRNAETREILDRGLIEGSTGDTPSLMLAASANDKLPLLLILTSGDT